MDYTERVSARYMEMLKRDNRELRRAVVMLLEEFGSYENDNPEWRNTDAINFSKRLLARLNRRRA
jgi:hypothetical protein